MGFLSIASIALDVLFFCSFWGVLGLFGGDDLVFVRGDHDFRHFLGVGGEALLCQGKKSWMLAILFFYSFWCKSHFTVFLHGSLYYPERNET